MDEKQRLMLWAKCWAILTAAFGAMIWLNPDPPKAGRWPPFVTGATVTLMPVLALAAWRRRSIAWLAYVVAVLGGWWILS
jgi:hypothetical protein